MSSMIPSPGGAPVPGTIPIPYAIALMFGTAILSALIARTVWKIRIRRLHASLMRMLDAAMKGSLTEETFDESLHSALESRMHDYLAAAETSVQAAAAERAHIKELISDISHQTKTPVSNILLYAALLSEQELPADSAAYVRELSAQAEKLRFLTDVLVKMSRLETGVFTLHPADTPLEPMLASLQTQWEPSARRKGLALTYAPTGAHAFFDAKWTQEALGNILDNAVKYTDKGSVSMEVIPYELFVCVKITDTGIGIPEEELSLIFRRFYRSQAVRSEDGLGIGLYLAREIVSREGGYIKVSSAVGTGSSFQVFLPAGARKDADGAQILSKL